MAQKKSPARKIGESNVKSIAGLTFGTRDTLPARQQQAIDPQRLAAAQSLLTQLRGGAVAGDGKDYGSQKESHLAMMVYFRLAKLAVARGKGKFALHYRHTENAGKFRWALWGEEPKVKATAPKAPAAPAPAKT